jgi:hypothetical protein
MAVVAVTFDGTRVNESQVYTSWGNYGGSGAGGAAEAPIAYQNGLACNRKQSTTGGALGGIDFDPGAGAVDMTGSTRRLWFVKAIISDSFDCNTSEGLRMTIGSAAADTNKYNLAGSTATNDAHLAYPAQGGYILTAIDPTITFWPITTTGTIDNTIIDYFGIQGSWITGQAKAENLALDSIDIGTGLYLVGGTSTDPDALFTTYVEKDQDITTNRWGCVSGAGATVNAWCVLRAGGAIEFTDVTSVVNFKDGYHSAGLTGVLHELDTAGSTWSMGALLTGEGKLYNSGAIDTRPDYVISGTTLTGTYDLSGTLRNFRNVTLTSVVDADGASIECQLLTQATAEIQNSTIKTNSLTNVACLQDPTFGTTTGLHDTTFQQTGVGHAIEALATGTWTGIKFTGYDGTTGSNLVASSGATDAAIFNDTGGAISITISGGGDIPSVRNGVGATTTIISGAVTVTANAALKAGTPVESARVYLRASNGTGPFPYLDSVTITRTTTLATVAHTAHGMATNDKITIAGISDKTVDNAIHQITFIDANSYSFPTTDAGSTSYTGTIVSTFVALNGLTGAGGDLSTSRVYSSAQPVTGWTRKSSGTPYLQEGVLIGTISSTTGFNGTAVMLVDE